MAPASSAAGEHVYDLDNDTTGGKPLVVGLAGGTGSGVCVNGSVYEGVGERAIKSDLRMRARVRARV